MEQSYNVIHLNKDYKELLKWCKEKEITYTSTLEITTLKREPDNYIKRGSNFDTNIISTLRATINEYKKSDILLKFIIKTDEEYLELKNLLDKFPA